MSTAIQTVWESVLSTLKSELSYTSFETWFQGIVPLSLEDQALTIGVPDAFTKGGLERRFKKRIEDVASASYRQPISLIVEVSTNGHPPSSSSVESPVRILAPSMGDTLSLNPELSLIHI